jgi:hypothetical protein
MAPAAHFTTAGTLECGRKYVMAALLAFSQYLHALITVVLRIEY